MIEAMKQRASLSPAWSQGSAEPSGEGGFERLAAGGGPGDVAVGPDQDSVGLSAPSKESNRPRPERRRPSKPRKRVLKLVLIKK